MSGFTGTTANIKVKVGVYAAPGTGSGTGTVTSVTSANTDISITNPTTSPILTLNSSASATASTIAKRDASGNLAGNITGNSAGFTGSLAGDVTGNQGTTKVTAIQNVPVSTTVPTNGEALVYNSTTGKYEPNTVASSGVSSVNSQTGAVAIESTGATLAVSTPTNGNVNLDVNPNTTNQKVQVLNNGTSIGTRKAINLIPGTSVTISGVDNSASDRVDVTINSTASGGGGGTVTSVTSANADITVANTTSTPTLTLNSSSTPSAGKVVKYDSNALIETNNISMAISKKTANYTLTLSDHTVKFDTTSGALTATLPPAASATNVEFVVSIDVGTHSLTLAANAAELICGTNSWTINNVGSALSVHSDGIGWSFT